MLSFITWDSCINLSVCIQGLFVCLFVFRGCSYVCLYPGFVCMSVCIQGLLVCLFVSGVVRMSVCILRLFVRLIQGLFVCMFIFRVCSYVCLYSGFVRMSVCI